MIKLINDDCLNAMKEIADNSIDSIVTDPPYGLSFMGKKWDYEVPSVEIWKEALRVLKPGGHLLSFSGTRTYHRMVVNIEDAGFEIRDQIQWIYGSGFPKSQNISLAIDKQNGPPNKGRATHSIKDRLKPRDSIDRSHEGVSYDCKTEHAKKWQGWGTALKPANEPICLARKPISEKTVASNVLKHGTGAMNIDESRVEGVFESGSKESENSAMSGKNYERDPEPDNPQGRWPANVILDEEAGKILDEQSGLTKSTKPKTSDERLVEKAGNSLQLGKAGLHSPDNSHNDSGGASRFFYCAKTSKSERNRGCEELASREWKEQEFRENDSTHLSLRAGAGRTALNQNFHPTVKPNKLMSYLINLITPPNGIVLDPFMGSGSTGVACKNLNRSFIGIEKDAEYFKIARKRINEHQ